MSLAYNHSKHPYMQSKKLLSKNYIHIRIHHYVFPCYNFRGQFSLHHQQNSSEGWWIISLNSIKNHSHLKNVLKWKDLFRLDCGFRFHQIYQNLTSIQINFKISSVNAICINLRILSNLVMNLKKFKLVWK